MVTRCGFRLIVLALLVALNSLACLGGRAIPPPVSTAIVPAATTAVVPPGAATAFPSKPGQSFAVTVTEKQINDSLTQSLTGAPNAPLTNAHVSLQPGKIILTGSMQLGPFSSDVVISGAVTTSGGKPILQIVDIVAGVSVPSIVTSALSDQLNVAFDNSITSLPADVSAVEIRQGEILIVGTSK